jgi:undecaprenyl-diphosphatase
MTILQAIILGSIQGLAEFLPISSSGHLAIAAHFLGQSEAPLLFDILLHLATLGAVCLVFRSTIGRLIAAAWRFVIRKNSPEDRSSLALILALMVATAFTGIIGFAIKDFVANISLFWVSCCLAITGVVLLASSLVKPKNPVQTPGLLQALWVGIAQGIGVIPGISRSGSTISASLFSGLDRKAAGEFSFLLSIPAILAAFMLELKDADTLAGTVSVTSLGAGMLSAFLVGYLALKFLIGLINRGKLGWFAAYLIPAGISLAIWFALA